MDDEDDISAEKETESEGSWLQSKDEQRGRQKSSGCQKSKGKSKIICLMNQGRNVHCGLFFS